MAEDLDALDELRDLTNIRITTYQQRIAKSYNNNIKIRRLRVGDHVLRKVLKITIELSACKLSLKWDGPYLIDSKASTGHINRRQSSTPKNLEIHTS